MCIICFLEDANQSRLRKTAQTRCDRFEQTLDTYKTDFLYAYKNIGKIDDCKKYKNLNDKVKDWTLELQKNLPTESDINVYFEKIKQTYLNWISQKQDDVIKDSKELFNQIDYQNRITDWDENLLLRARKSNNLFSKEDLYHIPFNKRYLIDNQRYSISGIPSLYLGFSIPDIVSELRGKYDDLDKYNFSGFFLKEKESLKIYDFTNPFPKIFSQIKAVRDAGNPLDFYEKGKGYIQSFYLFILINCCSFVRRDKSEGNVFSEEYVLPQLVTQFIYNQNFNGIAYTSTRINDNVVYSKESYYQNAHKLNYVLFTKYSAKDNYDYNLLDKFYITEPIMINSYFDVSDDEIESVKHDILRTNKFPLIQKMASCSGILTQLNFDKVFIKENGDETQYWQHQMGKMHRYFLYCSLLTVRNSVLNI